jgi:hypothetical protein
MVSTDVAFVVLSTALRLLAQLPCWSASTAFFQSGELTLLPTTTFPFPSTLPF